MQHWVSKVRNQKSGVRTLSSLKSEVWSMKSKFWSRMSEVRSRIPSSAFALKQSVRKFYTRPYLFVALYWQANDKSGENSCRRLRPLSVLGSFGVVLMSFKVNFHLIRLNRDLKIRGRRRQRKRRWKSEFAFFQSSSQLLQVTNFVKCRRTLQKLNS